MATTANKQKLLEQVVSILQKRYKMTESESLPVLEQLIYSIIREGSPKEAADSGFANLRTKFVDWNDVRVSTVQEVSDVLPGLSNRGDRARRIIGVLQEWFELTYSFDMEEVAKKGLKEGSKKIARLNDVNDYSVAWVTQHGFGGHAIPLDDAALRVLRRLGVLDGESESLESLRGTIEHYVPKSKGLVFVEVVGALAHDVCKEDVPLCGQCLLKDDCPTGQQHKTEAKPRKSR